MLRFEGQWSTQTMIANDEYLIHTHTHTIKLTFKLVFVYSCPQYTQVSSGNLVNTWNKMRYMSRASPSKNLPIPPINNVLQTNSITIPLLRKAAEHLLACKNSLFACCWINHIVTNMSLCMARCVKWSNSQGSQFEFLMVLANIIDLWNTSICAIDG